VIWVNKSEAHKSSAVRTEYVLAVFPKNVGKGVGTPCTNVLRVQQKKEGGSNGRKKRPDKEVVFKGQPLLRWGGGRNRKWRQTFRLSLGDGVSRVKEDCRIIGDREKSGLADHTKLEKAKGPPPPGCKPRDLGSRSPQPL